MTITGARAEGATSVTGPPVGSSRRSVAERSGVGAVAFVVTGAFLSWGLTRPALWVDESATVAATHRTWPHLFHLLQGPEAPLVPYYLVLKPLAALGSAVGLPLEAQYRWLSVAAVALAASLLCGWLYGRLGTALSAATLAVLLLTAGITRYGQEARPYPLTALLAVVATLVWFRLREVESRRPRWGLSYALAVGALACLHLLAATLVIAHLVAAALLGESRQERREAVLRTLGAAAVGAVLSAPFTALGLLHAKGPSTATPATATRLWETFVQAFTWFGPFLGVGWVLLLAGVGAFALRLPRYRTIAVVALCWAIVPLALLVPAMLVRPTLMRLRYLVFVLPGWAILGGLGVVVLGQLVRVGVRRMPSAASYASPAAVAVGLVVIVAVGFSQWPSLTRLRAPDGHGEDVRPALAFIEAHPGLPVMLSSRTAGSLLAAYRPDLGARLLGARLQYDGTTIWPTLDSVTERRELLRDHPEVVVLVRNTLNDECRRRDRERVKAFVNRCAPHPLTDLGYRAVSTRGIGRGYAAAVVRRP